MKNILTYKNLQILLFIGLATFILVDAQRECDMNIFLAASRDLAQQKNIYTEIYQGWLHYFYSPLFAVLLSPFTHLPEYWVNVLWLTFNAALLFRVWTLLKEYLPLQHLTEVQQRWLNAPESAPVC